MITTTDAPARQESARRMLPPWLWVWLGADLLAGMPSYIANLRGQAMLYLGNSPQSRAIATLPFTLLRLSALVAVLPIALLATGVVATALPQLRGAWVERRFGLASDDRPVIAQMQRFVDQHDPSIRLMVTIRSDQMARIYPVGWRTARIAVFLPLAVLWRTSRPAAQAILMHEIAHRRQGDHLIVGLGSPFTWLVRIWAVAFVLLMLAPLAFFFAVGGGALAQLVSAQSVLEFGQLPGALLLPVTALWLAEFSADQLTAQAVGRDGLRRALLISAASRSSVAARAFALLSHPPRRLRLRAIDGRPAVPAVLLAAWPVAAMACQLLVTIVGAVPAELLIGQTWRYAASVVLSGVHEFLLTSRVMLAVTVVMLLIWPALARPWQLLWSGRRDSGAPRPWWPYLVAAALPTGLLILPATPIQWSINARFTLARPQDACTPFVAWNKHGEQRESLVISDLTKALVTTTPTARARDSAALAAAAKAALADKPPGAARPSYITAMTDFVVVAADLRHDQRSEAIAEGLRAAGANRAADEILIVAERRCRRA